VVVARYGRILALEQPEPGRPRLYSLMCLDRTSRYSTATSRALYKAIEELERVQAARRAREDVATQANEEQPEEHAPPLRFSDTRY